MGDENDTGAALTDGEAGAAENEGNCAELPGAAGDDNSDTLRRESSIGREDDSPIVDNVIDKDGVALTTAELERL
jgi:hypothetical protein